MATSTTPIISITIPTYEMKGQGVFYLERCLRSIKNQKNIDAKLIEIVITDHSKDNAIKNFCENTQPSLKYHRIETKRGVASHNLNKGIKLAQGAYIKILFQDDVLVEETYLEVLFKTIEEEQPQCILTGALHTIDGVEFFDPIIPASNPYFLFGNNTVSSPSVITIANKFAQTMLFDEHLKMLFDCDFYHRLFNYHQKISVIDSIHIGNGIWEGQSQHHINKKQFTKEVRYLHWKFPSAGLTILLPKYKKLFFQKHPTADLPFSEKIHSNWLEKLIFKISSNLKK